MPDIHTYIPDRSLLDAVREQIVAQKLGDVRAAASIDQLAADSQEEEACVAVIDAAAVGAAEKATLAALAARAGKPVLLFLGDVDDDDLATESFAKPFRLGHLVTRLRYYLETAPLLRETAAVFGPYRLEPQNRRIVQDGRDPIRLTEKETALLVFLARNGAPATRAEILAAVWGYDERIDTHTLETHIYQLRRKLDADGGGWLINEAGAYRLAGGQAT